MAEEFVRTHIMLPKALIQAVDELVGHRKRSAFIVQAVEERLTHERLGRALAATRGSLNKAAHPEWDTPEKTSAWVRESRLRDDASTERKIRRRGDRDEISA